MDATPRPLMPRKYSAPPFAVPNRYYYPMHHRPVYPPTYHMYEAQQMNRSMQYYPKPSSFPQQAGMYSYVPPQQYPQPAPYPRVENQVQVSPKYAPYIRKKSRASIPGKEKPAKIHRVSNASTSEGDESSEKKPDNPISIQNLLSSSSEAEEGEISFDVVQKSDGWVINAQVPGFEFRHICVLLTLDKGDGSKLILDSEFYNAVLIEAHRDHKQWEDGEWKKYPYSSKKVIRLNGTCSQGSLLVEKVPNKPSNVKISILKKRS